MVRGVDDRTRMKLAAAAFSRYHRRARAGYVVSTRELSRLVGDWSGEFGAPRERWRFLWVAGRATG